MNPLAAPEQTSAGQATAPQAKPADRLLRGVSRLPGLRTLVPPVLLLAAGVALWQLLVSLKHVDGQIFPGPWLVARATWDDRTDLWPAIGVTTEEAVLGLAGAIFVALVPAVAIHTWVPGRRWVSGPGGPSSGWPLRSWWRSSPPWRSTPGCRSAGACTR